MKFFIIFCSFFLQFSYAQTHIWDGYIGKSKIYFYLPCDVDKKISENNECSRGRYFYRTSLQDIQLDDTLPSTEAYTYNLQVKHNLAQNTIPEELFELNYQKGELVGYWVHGVKHLKVKLKPLQTAEKEEEESDFFSTIRRKFLQYKRDRIETITSTNKEFVWIKELHSKTDMFRLGNGFSTKIRKQINPLLDKVQEEDSIFTLTCTDIGSYGTAVDIIENKITYLSKDLLEYSHFSYYLCGAYPDFYTDYFLIDLHSAKHYMLEDILTFQKNIPPNDEKHFEAREMYEILVAKKLRALAFKVKGMKLEPNKERAKETNIGYEPYELDHWKNMSFSYEKNGIRFFLNFSTYNRCFRGDNYLIPFSLLKKYKNKSFPYHWD